MTEDADEDDTCRECSAPLDDGEGYDGLCGDCADRAEAAGEWLPADPTTRFVYRLYIDAPTAEEANRYLAEHIGITGWRRVGMHDSDEWVAALRRATAVRSSPDAASDSEKLRYLADLFDATDIVTGAPGREVQDDLRRIAVRLDELVELDEVPEIAELLATINNSLTNGSQMTRGNLAFEYLCTRLGIARGQYDGTD